MQIQLLTPDTAPAPVAQPSVDVGLDRGSDASGGGAFARLVDAAGSILGRAERAEAAFVQHRGGLQEMVVERARADVALAIAASAAQRATQAIGSILGMQI